MIFSLVGGVLLGLAAVWQAFLKRSVVATLVYLSVGVATATAVGAL